VSGSPPTVRGRSLWHDARRRLAANRAAMVSLIILGAVALFALLGPLVNPNPYWDLDLEHIAIGPSLAGAHWFGTDSVGRDLFVRVAVGARVSLLVGVLATSVSLVIGVTYGAVAGYVGGRLDAVMMRFVDVLYSLPFLFFVILLMVVFGRNIFLIFVAIGAVEWLTMARIVRGQTLSIREREFIEAARAGGQSGGRIILRHIVPNVVGAVIVYATLTIPQIIMAESFLSFLGLGVQEPLTSWGVLVADGAAEMETSPWMLAFPAAFLALTLLCFNFFGDGLRDALDAAQREG